MSTNIAPALPDTASGAVSLQRITKSFGDVTAIDGLDLEVHAGEFLSLLGPSGCGKTTLLRMMAGFEYPDSGDIILGNASLLGVPPHKRSINTVFQSYALFPHMTVGENIAYGLRQRRTPRSEINTRVTEALDMVQMRAAADRNPAQLSGGQAQRIGLARALVNRPDVLLLDEPMSALDRKLRDEMQLELKILQKQIGTTFIFVTHDQEEALSMSDRIVVMLDGAIQQVGDARDIYAAPQTAFVAGFIGRQNFFDATVSAGRMVTPDGVLDAPTANLPSGSGTARLAVRPEAVTLCATRPDTPTNSIPGRLAGISFLGDVIQYLVITANGKEILSRVPRSESLEVAVDDNVFCAWDPQKAQVFQT